jgi:predicted O-linked N-acetylglucosamine transferase (SPINDLY family)
MAQHLQSQSAGILAGGIAPPPAPTPDALCSEAMSLQLAGLLDLAEGLYRGILQTSPAHAAANYCLGMLHVQKQRPADGLPFLLAALQSDPTSADYWLGYLEGLLLLDRAGDAQATLALGRQHGLGGAAVEDFAERMKARLCRPIAAVAATVATAVATADASTGVASPARADRRRERRVAGQQERALLATLKQRRFAEALTQSRALTERFPERGPGWKTLGALLWSDARSDEALLAMQTSARLSPRDAEAHSNLGSALIKLERFDEAQASLNQALKIDPRFAPAYAHFANLYEMQGRYAEVEACLRSALALRSHDVEPGDVQQHTTLLFMLSHNPAMDADSLFAEHCRVGAYLEGRLRAAWPRHPNVKDPNRRLKIGFVSADFRNHAVATFIEPVLAQLQKRHALELYGYYNHESEDHVTSRLRGYFEHWRPIVALSDLELGKQIMDDGIDVLLDLSGHTSFNRLRAFAHKPAPLQISWIGYPGTTGLRAMDYYFADRHFLPPGVFDEYFTEKLVYLPTGAPFRPDETAPPIQELPALRAGHLVFGSFNRMGKINAATVGLWSQLLRALPEAKMIVAGIPADGGHNQRLADWFAAEGIALERLRFHARCAMDVYLALHHEVDICLDTIPYSGGTTTYHAYWMGVPTLTVAGSTPASRQGAAIMGQVGLDGFVATDAADFVAKGFEWAGRLTELAEVRLYLRERWQQSPIREPDVVADSLDRAFRHMWSRWCAGLPSESFEIDASEPTRRGDSHQSR